LKDEPNTPKSPVSLSPNAFWVPLADITAQNYDLSINRYKQQVHMADQHDDPRDILKRLKALENEIQLELVELEGMLR
jgi:type I restriction enzyme M protein